MSTEIYLINVTGQDKPGLMSELSGVFSRFGAHLLDIGQAVIHEELALGILVRVAAQDTAAFCKEVEGLGEQAGSIVRLTEVTPDNYKLWLAASGQKRFILTLLTQGDGSVPLHAASTLTHRFVFNIDTIRRLTDRGDAALGVRGERLCVQMRLRGAAEQVSALRSDMLLAADESGFDFSLQEDNVFRRTRRLVAFDMDSTLITAEVMDELAKRHGVGDEVVAITHEAMSGRIDFKESFRRRARLLRGMPVEVLDDVTRAVQLNAGADRLLKALQHFGYKTAVISGGFQYVGEHLRERLGIDYVYANALVSDNGVMTGEVQGDIVDAQRKALLLQTIADGEGIALQQTIAIGDGANDLPMLASAGLGVAFHAKAVVRESAAHAISNFGLDAILYLIGFSDRDIDEALSG